MPLQEKKAGTSRGSTKQVSWKEAQKLRLDARTRSFIRQGHTDSRSLAGSDDLPRQQKFGGDRRAVHYWALFLEPAGLKCASLADLCLEGPSQQRVVGCGLWGAVALGLWSGSGPEVPACRRARRDGSGTADSLCQGLGLYRTKPNP